MSKGRHARKSSGGAKVIVLILLLLLAAVLVFFGMKILKDKAAGNEEVGGDLPQESSEISEIREEDETSEVSGEESEEAPLSSEEVPEESSDASQGSPEESGDESPDKSENSTEIPQMVDAEYETWLASAMVMGISMDYMDFEITGIYAEKATALADKAESAGVYVTFTSEGTEYAVYSRPIEAERDEAGSRDISSTATGFATFDLVDMSEVPADPLVNYSIDELQDTIALSMLVSVYYH